MMFQIGENCSNTQFLFLFVYCGSMISVQQQHYNMLDDYINVIHLFVLRAGKPPVGLHLDVLKGDKLIQVSFKKLYK